MAVGLRIRNNGNILQIDGTYRNLELLATGTVSMDLDDNNNGRYANVYIPPGYGNVICAVRGSAQGVWVVRRDTQYFRIYVGGRDSGYTVTYYLFSEPSQATPRGGVGLVVRNENTGQVVFNSNKKYLRVLQQYTGAVDSPGVATINYPGKAIAVVQNVRAWKRIVQTGGPEGMPIFQIDMRSMTIKSPNVSTIQFDFRTHMVHTGFGGTQPSVDGLYWTDNLVIDVTGY